MPHRRSSPRAEPLRRGTGSLVLVALLAACGPAPREEAPADPAADEPRAGGTLVATSLADIDGVNTLLASGRTSQEVIDRMFLRLLEEQPDFHDSPPTFAPRLARAYEWSDGRRTLTFQLRDDVHWSDGEPVTAEDVRFTWLAQTHPEVAWGYAHAKAAIEDVEVVDATTVRFHFSDVYAYQLADANEGAILPAHRWGELPFERWRERADWFVDNLVVSGPFVLESWEPQQQLVLVRNERYFEPGRPYLDRVVFRVIPDQTSQISQLLAGRVDFVEGIPPGDAARVERADHLALDTFWHRQYTHVAWNVARPLFADPEVRRALTLAIDREAIIDTLWYGYARVSISPILSTVWARHPDLEPWPYDPAEARRILERKGWRDTNGDGYLERDGRRFSFELTTNSGNQLRIDTTVMIQEQLRRIGVEARPRALDFNTLVARNLAGDFDATISAWAIDTTLDLRYAFHSDSIEDGYNYGGYVNAEVDDLIERIRAETDTEAALPLFYRLQEILHQEQPYTFLWEPQRLIGRSARLRDNRSNPLGTYFQLDEWWLAPPR